MELVVCLVLFVIFLRLAHGLWLPPIWSVGVALVASLIAYSLLVNFVRAVVAALSAQPLYLALIIVTLSFLGAAYVYRRILQGGRVFP